MDPKELFASPADDPTTAIEYAIKYAFKFWEMFQNKMAEALKAPSSTPSSHHHEMEIVHLCMTSTSRNSKSILLYLKEM